MLLSIDKSGKLGAFTWLDEKDVGEEPIVVRLKPAYSAVVSVTDAFAKPVGGALVQMSVSTLAKPNWVKVGSTDARGIAKVYGLYYNGAYSFRAVREGYKSMDTTPPKVGSSGWKNRIEVVVEHREEGD